MPEYSFKTFFWKSNFKSKRVSMSKVSNLAEELNVLQKENEDGYYERINELATKAFSYLDIEGSIAYPNKANLAKIPDEEAFGLILIHLQMGLNLAVEDGMKEGDLPMLHTYTYQGMLNIVQEESDIDEKEENIPLTRLAIAAFESVYRPYFILDAISVSLEQNKTEDSSSMPTMSANNL